ncbi:hypothetical protein BSKO_01671 [Bryopsis sp. KO-2023]|nr:hypothetical protein BSKO_01671 [Bryopsis sp. KO-2023]
MPNLLRKLSHRLSRERSGDRKERSESRGEEESEGQAGTVSDNAGLVLDPHSLEVLEEVIRLKRENAIRDSNHQGGGEPSARDSQADIGVTGDGEAAECPDSPHIEHHSELSGEDQCDDGLCEEDVEEDFLRYARQGLDCYEDFSPGSEPAERMTLPQSPMGIDVYIPDGRRLTGLEDSVKEGKDVNSAAYVPEISDREQKYAADAVGHGTFSDTGLPVDQIMALARSLRLEASDSTDVKKSPKMMENHGKYQKRSGRKPAHKHGKHDMPTTSNQAVEEFQGDAEEHFINIADDEQVVEGANKALERYLSPEINYDRLRHLMEAEKALERELLGIDQSLVEKLPAKVNQRLSGRARAMAAAETVATGATFEFSERLADSSGMQSLGRSSRLDYQLTRENATSLGYAARAKVYKARKSLDFGRDSSPSIVQGGRVSPPPPSEESQPEAVEWKPAVRPPVSSDCRSQQLSSVYDRTFAWKRRSERKCYQERVKKEVAGLANCTFNPVVNRTATSRKSAQHSPTVEESPQNNTMDSNHWWDEEEEEEDRNDPGLNDTALTVCSDGSNATVSTQACLRLYAQAQAKYARYHQKVEDAMIAERRSFQAQSPRALPLSKRIYGHDQGTRRPKVKPLATGTKKGWSGARKSLESYRKTWYLRQLVFYHRQEYYAEEKEKKIRATRETGKISTAQLSPGTRRILKEKAKRLEDASINQSEGSNVQELVQMFAEDLAKSEECGKEPAPSKQTASTPKKMLSYFDPECSFSPKITKKAMKMSKRTLEELSAGDTLRREALLEIKRAEKESQRMSEATFKPQLYKGYAYEYVEPKLNMKDPASYLVAVQEKQRQQRQQEREAQRAREEQEVKECTFKPRTKALPEYIARMAKEHSKKKQNQQQTELDDPFRRVWFV